MELVLDYEIMELLLQDIPCEAMIGNYGYSDGAI